MFRLNAGLTRRNVTFTSVEILAIPLNYSLHTCSKLYKQSASSTSQLKADFSTASCEHIVNVILTYFLHDYSLHEFITQCVHLLVTKNLIVKCIIKQFATLHLENGTECIPCKPKFVIFQYTHMTLVS